MNAENYVRIMALRILLRVWNFKNYQRFYKTALPPHDFQIAPLIEKNMRQTN